MTHKKSHFRWFVDKKELPENAEEIHEILMTPYQHWKFDTSWIVVLTDGKNYSSIIPVVGAKDADEACELVDELMQ